MAKHLSWKQKALDENDRHLEYLKNSLTGQQIYDPRFKVEPTRYINPYEYKHEQLEKVILASGSEQDLKFRQKQLRKFFRRNLRAWKTGKQPPSSLFASSIPQSNPRLVPKKGFGFTRRPVNPSYKPSVTTTVTEDKSKINPESRNKDRRVFTKKNIGITGTVVGTTMIAYGISEQIKKRKKEKLRSHYFVRDN